VIDQSCNQVGLPKGTSQSLCKRWSNWDFAWANCRSCRMSVLEWCIRSNSTVFNRTRSWESTASFFNLSTDFCNLEEDVESARYRSARTATSCIPWDPRQGEDGRLGGRIYKMVNIHEPRVIKVKLWFTHQTSSHLCAEWYIAWFPRWPHLKNYFFSFFVIENLMLFFFQNLLIINPSKQENKGNENHEMKITDTHSYIFETFFTLVFLDYGTKICLHVKMRTQKWPQFCIFAYFPNIRMLLHSWHSIFSLTSYSHTLLQCNCVWDYDDILDFQQNLSL
jgi:hypothetical protein